MSRQTKLIRVAVGIIQRGGEVLLGKRPDDKPYSGYWEFPGGKIEPGETGQDALHRELHEELGVMVLNTKHCFDHQHEYPDKTVLLELWLVTAISGEPQSNENQELCWVKPNELDQFNLLAGNWAILKKIKHLL